MSAAQPVESARGVALLLSVAPLLGASDTIVSAIGVGACLIIVAALATTLFTLARRWLAPEIQFAALLSLAAGATAALELLLRAYFYDLHQALEVFLPLLAVNVALAHASAGSEPAHDVRSFNAVQIAAGVGLTLVVLGAGRELVGRGSLFHDAGVMLGRWSGALEIKAFSVDMGFLLGMLPPAAFMSLAVLLATRNWFKRRRALRAS